MDGLFQQISHEPCLLSAIDKLSRVCNLRSVTDKRLITIVPLAS